MNRTKPYKSNRIRPLFLWPLCDTHFGFLSFWFGFGPPFVYCVHGSRTTLWYGFEISIQTIPQTSVSPKNPSSPLTLELEKFFLKSNHLGLHFGLIDIDLPHIWNWLATNMNKQVVIASNYLLVYRKESFVLICKCMCLSIVCALDECVSIVARRIQRRT